MKTKTSDYELLSQIKRKDLKENIWEKITLWDRYQPVVHKRARYTHGIVAFSFEYEDIVQDFYLAFEKALNYINMEKIPTRNFHFGTIYFYFLRKAEKKLKKAHFLSYKNQIIHSFANLFESNNETEEFYCKHLPSFVLNFDELASYLEETISTKIFKILTKNEKIIVDELLQSKSITAISKSRQEEYFKTYKQVCKIKLKLKSIIEGER